MKKLLCILFIAGVFSCSSDKKDDVSKKSENQPGIQNVNGTYQIQLMLLTLIKVKQILQII
jgi:hypothetical protein